MIFFSPVQWPKCQLRRWRLTVDESVWRSSRVVRHGFQMIPVMSKALGVDSPKVDITILIVFRRFCDHLLIIFVCIYIYLFIYEWYVDHSLVNRDLWQWKLGSTGWSILLEPSHSYFPRNLHGLDRATSVERCSLKQRRDLGYIIHLPW